MTYENLPRSLWYENQGKTVDVDQAFLSESSRSLVVLGEAGMGKSTLLKMLSSEGGYSFCTARQLINRRDASSLLGNGNTLVIDALDEVGASREGDAVDLVLRKLGELDYPRFVLSCRVADWRSATALQGIADQYGDTPVELHLAPLDRPDAVKFLSRTLGPEQSNVVIAHLEQLGLEGLWKNPQTLSLVEQVSAVGALPTSKGNLFSNAVPLLRTEHREEKVDTVLASSPEERTLDAAGAAFAALILTGKVGISRKVQISADEINLPELSVLPDAASIGGILAARLFEARSTDSFTYSHRAIGEFLAARWLAKQASTPRKRRRLLSLFNRQALVPASLRGVHAWLAWHSPSLASSVLKTDPMGVVEYGDADNLTVEQGRVLINALRELSKENPRFREWGPYRIGGIIQKQLLPEIVELITAPDTEFGLRLMVLQALKKSSIAESLVEPLMTVLLDSAAIFANRSEAGDRLAELGSSIDWQATIRTLMSQRDENGVRLALELMGEVGFERFDASVIVEAIFAQIPRIEHHAAVYYGLERSLPDSHIGEVLNLLVTKVAASGKSYERLGESQITDLAYGLIARHLKSSAIDPRQLWRWLEPFDSQSGYRRENREDLAEWFRNETVIRRAIQSYVLLEVPGEKTLWQRALRLSKRSVGLSLTEDDVITLLKLLDSNDRQDERWRDAVQLTAHGPADGVRVREEARRFAEHRIDLLAWIDKLAEPRVYEWQLKQEEGARKRRAKRAMDWAEHRADYRAHIQEVMTGVYGYIVNPAKAYLKLFSDLGNEATDGPSRLVEWLEADLAAACLIGFEQFLLLTPPQPTAAEISESHADSKGWSAANIIVVALAERLRLGTGVSDLPDERLMAGLFELTSTKVDDHAGIVGLEAALADELRARGAWEDAMRLLYGPQFAHKLTYVNRLYSLLTNDADAELATKLAAEWLLAYPDMPSSPESELVDRLLRSQRRDFLTECARLRLADRSLDDERRLNWLAVAMIVDFEATLERLKSAPVDPALLWHIRSRIGDRRRDQKVGDLSAQQLYWIIEAFRSAYPVQSRPSSVTTGDTNPWDATEYINTLIGRLGNYTTEEAVTDITRLREAESDGYTEYLRIVAAEQRRARIEAEFVAPSLAMIRAATDDKRPEDSSQLQQVILEELAIIQKKVKGSDVDWYKDFYTHTGVPRVEDACRDAILKMLGVLPFEIQASPEGHLGDDKRCDIICSLRELMVPIEVKGQWHRDLWNAADRQLDHLYVNDWRADRGIYLVLWFGNSSGKALKSPPPNVSKPVNAEELLLALQLASLAAQEKRVSVFVLDLTRPGV